MTRKALNLLLFLLILAQPAWAAKPSIAYWLHGPKDGETVVLIHGFNSSHDTWEKLVPKLSKRYRVLVYDQPGHGLSPADSSEAGADYTPHQMALRLRALVEHLKIEKLHVVGHSMGGRTALKFAALYPDVVSSLVVEDMNFLPQAESKEKLAALRAIYPKVRDGLPSTFAGQEEAKAALSEFYTETEILYISASAKIDKDGKVTLGNRPEVTNLYLHEGLALDMGDELKSVRNPSAFFAADPQVEAVLTAEGIAQIREFQPEAKVKVFHGSGHTIHERADFADALLEFLKAH